MDLVLYSLGAITGGGIAFISFVAIYKLYNWIKNRRGEKNHE